MVVACVSTRGRQSRCLFCSAFPDSFFLNSFYNFLVFVSGSTWAVVQQDSYSLRSPRCLKKTTYCPGHHFKVNAEVSCRRRSFLYGLEITIFVLRVCAKFGDVSLYELKVKSLCRLEQCGVGHVIIKVFSFALLALPSASNSQENNSASFEECLRYSRCNDFLHFWFFLCRVQSA